MVIFFREEIMSDKKTDNASTNYGSKFSLIELVSILLLVGLVFVFVVPVNQAKISQSRVGEAINTMTMIGEKAEAFKNNPDNGYYPDISQLNLGDQTKSPYFEYTINADDSTLVAVTTPAFGKKGAALLYNLSAKQFSIGKDESDLESKKYINEIWLP
jgi:Tfp pilus assembly protein PilE